MNININKQLACVYLKSYKILSAQMSEQLILRPKFEGQIL